ncbi:hypothetical protein RO21_10555 [[Actinobacillus] muris]|uniref:Phage tail tape measure protein domain-containing protein n=1 Tax=Muribacter muris TaxID=67855 RepID=A0A0J5P5A3_9PAST|nr:phage tail tape measure protein [Muribacter muris]KMK50659.1 hypothetical protein RO21_10555 [[Actinobacillus] muris] [Muribacter muris]
MSQNLKLQVLLSTVDKLTAPFQKATQKAQQLSRTLGESKGALRQLNSQFSQNEKQIKKYRDALNPLKAQFNETSQKLEQARQKAKAMQRAFYDAKNPTAEFKQKLKEAQQAVSQLQQKKQALIDRTRRVRLEFKQAGFDAKKMAAAQSELKRKMKEASDSIKQQEERLKRLNQQQRQNAKYKQQAEKLKAQGDRVGQFGQKTMMGGTAILGSGYAMLSPALAFEQSFSKVQALARLDKEKDAERIKALRDQAIHLGATTAFTASEVADAQGYLAMAGFNDKQIKAATPSMLQMSMASGTDLARVADIASDISSGFKIQADDMGRVADVLTLTFTTSNTSLETLYETMKEGAPIATAAGQSFESAAALSGLLGNVGIKGSQAGTTLKNMFVRLAAPPKEAKKALDKLGIKTKDTKGNLKDVPLILKEIMDKTKSMGTGERLGIFDDIFGKIGLAGASELVSQADGVIQNYENMLKDAKGTVEKVSTTMTDNLLGDIKSLSSAKEDIGLAIYDTISGDLREQTQSFTVWLRSISQWVKANPELTKSIAQATAYFAAFLLVLGGSSLILSYAIYPIMRIILALGKFGMTIVKVALWTSKGLGIMGRAFLAVIPKILAFSAALLTNPITWIVLAIIALIAALVLLWKNWDTVKQALVSGWNWVCEVFDNNPILNILFPIIPLIRGIIWLIQNWGKVCESVSNWISQKWDELKNKAATVWGNIKGWLSDALQPLESLKAGVQWLIDNLSKISWEGIKQGAKDLGSGIKNYASEKANQAGQYISDKWHSVKSWLGLDQKWSGGYAGNGGKYEPKGIYHGGEYIMTKEATSRIGIANLNRLNYGKMAGLAALGSTVAVAQPMVQVDNRPPISTVSQPQAVGSVNQTVNITINAAQGQSEADIARTIQRILAEEQRKAQAKQRSSLRDRG